MKRFISDTRGNVAMIFGLTLVPIMGFAGAALDYSRATALREELRLFADQTALNVAHAGNPASAPAILANAEEKLRGKLRENLDDVRMQGSWLDGAHYQVTITADLRSSLLTGVPGMPKSIAAEVVTIVHRIPPTYRVLPPDMSMLDPEAGDYNRIYMYCYDPAKAAEPGADPDEFRTQFTAIADNSSTTVYDADLPECGAGEHVAYKLRNVRGARTSPNAWDDPSREVYFYYTDTLLDPNTRVLEHDVQGYRVRHGHTFEKIDMEGVGLLETVNCRNMEECKVETDGGVIPYPHRHRTPEQATAACEEGQYMYFGWEDRPVYPPGHPRHGQWTDADFDDIRLIVSCPEIIETDRTVRLVQ